MTPDRALRHAAGRLAAAGVPDPMRDASRLLGHAADGAYIHYDDLPQALLQRFDAAIDRRMRREPVSHIIGRRAFWTHEFEVNAHVLDPRPETETLVDLSLEAPFRRVLDLGTGSGCILISLLAEDPHACGVGTDISPEAVLVAGRNAQRIGVADRILLPLSEWWDDVGSTYDLIVSNPPYIAADEMPGLAPELGFEPRQALTDEGDGLGAYRAITAGLFDHLTPGGRVLLEIGPTQGAAVSDMLHRAGLENIAIHPDLDGRARVVSANRQK